MGNKGESSVKSVNKLMSFAQHRMAITKRMLALASLFLTLAVVPVHQAHAMSGFLSDAVSNSVDTNLTDTCGLCHFAFGGRETRGNYGMDYWLYDNDTMDVGQNAGLGAIDSSHDGRTNATIWAQTGNTSADGGATMANFPDKDQDGYIALWYRADTTGIYGEIADAAATGTGGSSGNTATGIVGWDIDDNDFAAGNIAWGTDVGASTPADVTAPGTVADFVSGALAATSINLAWSAPGDDGAVGGAAHMTDIRYATEALLTTYNGVKATTFNVHNAADWATMWDIGDTDIDGSVGYVAPVCGSGGGIVTAAAAWNAGEEAPLMRALHEPVPLAPTSASSYTLSTKGDDGIAGGGTVNDIVNGTTYWLALRTTDGVSYPNNAGEPFTDSGASAGICINENISGVSNIVAITAGASGTAIQSIGTTTGSDGSDTAGVVITGVGLNNIDGVRLVDATGTTVSVGDSITTPGTTSITVTLGTLGVTAGFYTLEVTSGGTTKAAWVDAFEVTTGGGDTTPPGEVTGFSVSDATTGGQLNLSWTNPGDGDFAGVEISRAQGSTPADCSSPVASLGVVTSWNDTTVTDDLSYTYRICTRDAQPNYSTGVFASGTPTTAADTTPPGEVTLFTVTNATIGNQLNLSWTNPGDGDFASVKISRAMGATPPGNCATPITTVVSPGTSFNDTGLTDGQQYSYLICTQDGIPNVSTGVPGSGTPTDTVAPAIVSGLSVSNAFVAGGQIDLSWTDPGDADFAGVAIKRATGSAPTDCVGPLATVLPGVYAYSDSTVSVGTEYFYTVCAQDEVPNDSAGVSGSATPTEPDVTAPGEVTSFNVVDATTGGQLNLSWINPGDGDFAGVEISRAQGSTPLDCSSPVASLGVVTSWNDTTVTDGLSYTYRICTRDAVPNYSTGVFTSATPTDSTAPAEVTGFSVTNPQTGNQLNLSWTNPGDADFVGVKIMRDVGALPSPPGCGTGTFVADLSGGETSYNDTTGLTDGTEYFYLICSYDAGPNYAGGTGNSAIPTDTTAPASVTGLSATNAFLAGGQVDLAWTLPPDTDGDLVGVTISRATGSTPANCNVVHDTVPKASSTYADTLSMTVDTEYFYLVCAQDEVPNNSASANASAIPTEPDIIAPGPVTGFNVNVNAAGNRLDLVWVNPGDGDLAGVTISRTTGGSPASCTSDVVATLGVVTSWSDTGLTDGVVHNYKICARDGVPNYSTEASDSNTPADTTAPANVTGFSINNPGTGTELNLNWTNPADADYAGVKISRALGAIPPADCTTSITTVLAPGTSYPDTGLTTDQEYSYLLCTQDEVPNTSVGTTNSGTPTVGLTGAVSPIFNGPEWFMIGVPSDLLTDNTFNGMFSTAAELNGAAYSYKWYSSAAASWAGGYGYTTTAEPGKGYFVYVPNAGTELNDEINGLNGAATVDVTLQPGGNIITNPYYQTTKTMDETTTEVAFCNVTTGCATWRSFGYAVDNGWVLNTIYRYLGAGAYDPQTRAASPALDDWYGYWLRVDHPTDTIKMRFIK